MSALSRQFSWILFGRVASALLQAVSFAVLARFAGPESFGLFALIYGVAIFVQVGTDFGLMTTIIYSRSSTPRHSIIGDALKIANKVTFVVSLLATALLLAMAHVDVAYLVLIPLGVWVGADRRAEVWLGIPLADGDTWHNAFSLVLRRSGALAVLLVFQLCGGNPVLGYSSGLAAFSVVAAWLAYRVSRDRVVSRGRHGFRAICKVSFPYWINSIGAQAKNLDVLIVASTSTAAATGAFGVASRLTTPLSLVPQAFSTVLMPAATRVGRGNVRELGRSLSVLTAATTAMYVAVGIAAPFVVPVILGPAYGDVASVVQVFCCGLVFNSIATQISALLQGWGCKREVAFVQTISTLVYLMAIAGLCPLFGVVGAAVSFVMSGLLQLVLLGLAYRKPGFLNLGINRRHRLEY